mgnify:CR=1 FL=1
MEAYLCTSLDRLLQQSFQDYEILLIDDGSKDSSGEICDRYAREHSRIRVVHKPNGGLSTARNAGIEHARGEYLTFCDPDAGSMQTTCNNSSKQAWTNIRCP